MSLNAQLLALLSTPAARSASDDDTRRSVARVIGCEPATAQAPGFNPNELARRRARLARRLAHLQQRIADAPAHALSYDVAEASALQTALVLFDAALAGGEPPTTGAPVHCHECKDLEAAAWRRRAEMDLGDTEEVKGATHMRLRWMLSLTVRQLGADLAAAQRERDEAVAVSESLAGDLSAATDRLASLEHQLDELDAEVWVSTPTSRSSDADSHYHVVRIEAGRRTLVAQWWPSSGKTMDGLARGQRCNTGKALVAWLRAKQEVSRG